MGPYWVHMLNIGIYRENMKISSCLKPQSLDIWYVASLSVPLPSLFKLCPWGQKWPNPGGHMFYIALFRANMKNRLVGNHMA